MLNLIAALVLSQANPVLPVIGGTDATPNMFPSAVAFGYCSGVLVHPNIVLSAAHCFPEFEENVEIHFGTTFQNPDLVVMADYCLPYAAFAKKGMATGTDWAYCFIADGVSEVKPVPAITAKELNSIEITRVTSVGFGRDENNEAGKKKVAQLSVVNVVGGEVWLTDTGDGLLAPGDSGGPTYVALPSGELRVLATTSYGGVSKSLQWEGVSAVTPMADWVLRDSGIDILSDRSETLSARWQSNPAEGDSDAEGCSTTSAGPMSSLFTLFGLTCLIRRGKTSV